RGGASHDGQRVDGQFGTPIAGGAALRAYQQARASKHLDVVGLHAHRGETIRTEGDLTGFVESVLAFTDTLHQELGLDLEVLDLGGSLCTPTVEHIAERDWRLNLTFFRDVPRRTRRPRCPFRATCRWWWSWSSPTTRAGAASARASSWSRAAP
ncbi:hypothetical protein ACLESD_46735, partial [Pyxidicoccus sp. 3LFB2]